MRCGKLKLTPVALSILLMLGARELFGQARIISLAATSPSDIGLVVTSGAVQTITGVTDNAVNNFPSPVVIQTTWSVNPGQTNTVNLVAYFAVPAQAMVGPSTQIPSSRILGRMSTGIPATFTPIDQNAFAGVGTAGGSLLLYSVNINGSNKSSIRSDNLDLQLDLVGFPTLPSGAYVGVLNLRVITQ
jgi:hypothetical protein